MRRITFVQPKNIDVLKGREGGGEEISKTTRRGKERKSDEMRAK